VSLNSYERLEIERGTIIHATRDFKALNFKEILEQHKVEQPDRFISPHPSVGGWNKFVKTQIATNKSAKSTRQHPAKKAVSNQLKSNARLAA
jgi:hypothetical protein